jgi:hypothetical protein
VNDLHRKSIVNVSCDRLDSGRTALQRGIALSAAPRVEDDNAAAGEQFREPLMSQVATVEVQPERICEQHVLLVRMPSHPPAPQRMQADELVADLARYR